VELLAPGLAEIHDRTGVPTFGVIPWMEGIDLDAEDSVALSRLGSAPARDSDIIDVAVVCFPRISNFTDIDALALEPQVHVRLVNRPDVLGDPDLIVLPGTKTTISDLGWMRENGLAEAIERVRHRSSVLGICGGYQMLGRHIEDAARIESRSGSVNGLSLMPLTTTFHNKKIVARRKGTAALVGSSHVVEGYEIHHGITLADAGDDRSVDPWIVLDGEEVAGYAHPHSGLFATSLHGLFENDGFRHAFLAQVAARRSKTLGTSDVSFAAAREQQIDRLADAIEEHIDLSALFEVIRSARSSEFARR
ncbi:MAG: cobyric acid synthase, partial [Acidimicrobiales bacterium]